MRVEAADPQRVAAPEVLLEPEGLALAGAWRRYFAARIGPSFGGRVVLEVGCFDARFLGAVAARHPDTAFVGLDWNRRSLLEGARDVVARGLSNVALIPGRADQVRGLFADQELHELWVFHPEPCLRGKARVNRLIAEPFLADAHGVLEQGGLLVLKTDHPGYYQWTLALFGVPEPALFTLVREDLAPVPPFGQSRRPRRAALLAPSEVPPPSAACRARFALDYHSDDFRQDPEAEVRAEARLFARQMTPYEARFARRRARIYYVELSRRAEPITPRS